MIRLHVDDELLDIPTHDLTAAIRMARALRPSAVVVSDTEGGPHQIPAAADTDLYTGDHVAHWTYPGETGEIVETEIPRTGRVHYVRWPDGITVPYLGIGGTLIRVTKAVRS